MSFLIINTINYNFILIMVTRLRKNDLFHTFDNFIHYMLCNINSSAQQLGLMQVKAG